MKNSNLLTLLTILFLSVCGDESDPEDFTFTCVDASECDVITNEDCIDLDTISNIFDFMPIECPGILNVLVYGYVISLCFLTRK